MHEVTHIDQPCTIYRSDSNQYIQYGKLTIIFKDSDQAKAFVDDFPMFFQCEGESPFGIYPAPQWMLDDKDNIVWYDSIADKMEEEKKYQQELAKQNKEFKNGRRINI